MTYVERATDLFMQGYGCCQAVVVAFAPRYGLDETTALRLAAGFGGGMGRLRMTCGAASALVMLAGLEQGQTEGRDREGKAECYRLVQQLLAEFRRLNGSLSCAEILGINGNERAHCSYIPSERTADYYRRRPCVAKVECAAKIFADYIGKAE